MEIKDKKLKQKTRRPILTRLSVYVPIKKKERRAQLLVTLPFSSVGDR